MIREKLLSVLNWIKDHMLILLEVVVRLSIGLHSKTNNPVNNSGLHEDNTESEEEG